MKRILIFGFLVVLSISSASPATRIDVSKSEAGGKLILKQRDLLVFRFPSNRTTGYCWSVVSSNPGVLKQAGEVLYEQFAYGTVRVGSGGQEIWKFQAMFAGLTTLTFFYLRPWERGVPPVRVVKWTVEVR